MNLRLPAGAASSAVCVSCLAGTFSSESGMD
jgi:hypothetical protein